VLTFRHTSEGRRSGDEATARHRFHAATTRPGPPCAGANNYDAMQGLHCTDCSMRAAAVASVGSRAPRESTLVEHRPVCGRARGD
jgi:hypothetical protein